MKRQFSKSSKVDKPATHEVHLCIPCDRYFLGYSTAIAHYDQIHALQSMSKKKNQRFANLTKDDFGASTKVVHFPQSSVNVDRLKEDEIERWNGTIDAEDFGQEDDQQEMVEEIQLDSMGASEIEKLMKNMYKQSSTKEIEGTSSSDEDDESEPRVSSSSDEDEETEVKNENEDSEDTRKDRRGRKRKNPGEVEIKLDSLKASEIETLMKGLFQVHDPPKMPYKNPAEGFADTDHVRRSGRRAKERFKKGFGDLDSSDEEIIKTGERGGSLKRRRKKNQDPDFDISHLGEGRCLADRHGPTKRGRGRPRKKLLCDDNTVIIKYETEDVLPAEHNDEHTKRYFCRFCKIQYNHLIHYSEHMKEKHGNPDGTYRCGVCERTHSCLKSLYKHFYSVHTDATTARARGTPAINKARDYCNTCDIQFEDGREFAKHVLETHLDEEGNAVCQICAAMNTDRDPPAFENMKQFLKHHRRHYNKDNGLIVEKRPKGPFKCSVCQKSILYYSIYVQHLQTHDSTKQDPSKNHECPVCRMRVSNITSFKRHFTKHLETNPFRCKFESCDKTFGDYYHLTKHLMAVHTRSGELLKCTECPARYCNAYYYQRHYRESHKDVTCPIPFSTANPMALLPSQLVRKKATSTGGSENNSENRRETSTVHVQAETVPAVIKEEIDSNKYDMDDEDNPPDNGEIHSEQALVGLQNKALVEDPVVLKMKRDNPEGYKLIADLVRLAKSAPKECYKCQFCDWSGGSYVFYERHVKNVHAETPSEPKGLSSKTGVKDGETPGLTLCCGSCGHQAETLEELTAHMNKVHIGKRKFPCTKCGTRFTSKSRLEDHDYRVHGDGEKFPCDKCEAICSSQMSLKSHMKNKHGPDKTFECSTCGKVLTTRLGFLEHKKRHSGQAKRSKCQICGQSYATVHVLSRHIQMMHTRTLKLVQVKGKTKKSEMQAIQAAAEAELQATEKQNSGKSKETPEAPTKDVDEANTPLLKEEKPANNEFQEIIGF